MSKDTSGPAFPQYIISNGGDHVDGGMTLRDYFAAKAMHGLMDAAMPMPEIAEAAYQMAEAFHQHQYDFTGDLELHEAIRARSNT